jgi:hypothetical protein
MRRKSKRTKRRKTVTQKGAKALAAGAAIAAGTQAYAAPVRFDNPAHGDPGHFHWPYDWLDITLDVASQSGSGGIKFHQDYFYYYTANPSWIEGAMDSAEMATEEYWAGEDYPFLLSLAAGETIPWADATFHYYGLTMFTGYSLIPSDQDVYLAVRVNLADQWHYGWVGVRRTGWDWELEAFAWGYETEPGVPIAAGIPEPDTLAMLALGFVAAGVAKRRR